MVFIIAELGVNWRSLSDCDLLIRECSRAGANAVKFQCYEPKFVYNDEFVKDGYIKHSRAQELNAIALKEEDIRYLYHRCKQHGVKLIITPMYTDAVKMIAPYVDMFKIRFADMDNQHLLYEIFRNNPNDKIILMSESECILPKDDNIKYLYCVPEYPPKQFIVPENMNGFDGFSCHYPNIQIPIEVCKKFTNVKFIECHVRLDHYFGDGSYEPIDQRVSITMSDLRELVKQIREIE